MNMMRRKEGDGVMPAACPESGEEHQPTAVANFPKTHTPPRRLRSLQKEKRRRKRQNIYQ